MSCFCGLDLPLDTTRYQTIQVQSDRLAISCVMEINSDGKVVDYDIFESVIKSNIQMTYKKVNSILEDAIIFLRHKGTEQKTHTQAGQRFLTRICLS